MEKVRAIVRSILSESIKRDVLNVAHDSGASPDWEPLYKFLKQIFGEKYKLAANGFMWYELDDFEGLRLNMYRNGVTRRYIFIDNDGFPYRIRFSDFDHAESIEKMSFEDAFNHIYENMVEMVSSICTSLNCEIPKDAYLLSYSKYSSLRDELLKKLGYNVFTFSKDTDTDGLKDVIKENSAKYLLSPEDRRDYLAWKRKNVSLRGVREYGEENGGMARFGSGLYTAALSNKAMARQYGKVYYVVNAVPKNPIVFNDANQAETWIGNKLVPMYAGEGGTRKFNQITTIAKAVQELGYDGLLIKGREMVNYAPPSNVEYFVDESQVISYWSRNIKKA